MGRSQRQAPLDALRVPLVISVALLRSLDDLRAAGHTRVPAALVAPLRGLEVTLPAATRCDLCPSMTITQLIAEVHAAQAMMLRRPSAVRPVGAARSEPARPTSPPGPAVAAAADPISEPTSRRDPRPPVPGLVALPCPCPPHLLPALGVQGWSDHVALYREGGDHVAWMDTATTGTAPAAPFQLFVEHPAMRRHLGPFAFGSAERPAVHALLVDRARGYLFVGTVAEVAAFLRPQPSPSAGGGDPRWAAALLQLRTTVVSRPHPGSPEQNAADSMEDAGRRRLLTARLARWLDALPCAQAEVPPS